MLFRRCLWAASLCLFFCAGPEAPLFAAEKAVANLAHIRLHGDLDETPVAADPIFGSSAENFKAKLDRIKKAKDDAAIQGLYLQIDGVQIGWGKLDELRRAIADFRAAGKKAFAYLESGEGKDYLVAVACDEVCVPEGGWLMLTGVRGGVTFFKDLFEKVGIQADMLQMGDFKGAAEPFTRNSMSAPFRKQFESVLDDYYENSLVDLIVRSRPGKKWTPAHVKKLIDQGPFTAKASLAAGLIDRIAYADQLNDSFKKTLEAERVVVKRNYGQSKSDDLDFSNPFALLKLLAPPKAAVSFKSKIAVIYATGVIVHGKGSDGIFGSESTGSTTMVEAIRQAERDKTVKAIVLRVDSPGGSALASDLIWNELNRSKKPVIASMSDTAASGGYYISMAARKIYAEPGTLTGSIGVVGGKLVLGGLEDKIGLKTEVIQRGANASILSSVSPFNESERKAMTALMKDVYDQFLDKAIQGRKKAGREMTLADLEKLAGGRIWTGRQAKEKGLIDELGTLDDAIAAAKELAGEKKDADLELLILPKPRSFIENLIESKADTQTRLSMGLSNLRGLPEIAGKLRMIEGLIQLKGEPVWMILPHRIEVR
jgi:protease-4